jgi:hypothetical protein
VVQLIMIPILMVASVIAACFIEARPKPRI